MDSQCRRLILGVLGIFVAVAGTAWAAEPDGKTGGFPKIDIRDLPFILIPEVGTDPDAGTTLG